MPEDFTVSRRTLEQATLDPVLRPEAHYLLWEVCQACGDPDAALQHLATATRLSPLRTRPTPPGVTPIRSVLALNTPGDFQANIPLPMLFDQRTRLHTLWLTGPADPELPPIDCVFIAIAQDDRHRAALTAADQLAATLDIPVINRGDIIRSLSRTGVCTRLAGIDGLIVPAQTARSRMELQDEQTPFIVRPRHSHAGRHLARIRSEADLTAYLRATGTQSFTTAPFVDYRSPDGQYRKCRIVFVDGQPYPAHLAIHDDWAVWYYNAKMSEAPAKQAEEARFLRDLAAYAGPVAMRALHAVAERIGLDYFGLDCAIMPDGQLLVFEVETGMIVHGHDPEPHKLQASHRIFRAVEHMIDGRVRASRPAAQRPHQDAA